MAIIIAVGCVMTRENMNRKKGEMNRITRSVFEYETKNVEERKRKEIEPCAHIFTRLGKEYKSIGE